MRGACNIGKADDSVLSGIIADHFDGSQQIVDRDAYGDNRQMADGGTESSYSG